MSIPLVQDNEKDSINTSLIAIKRSIERINALLGLADSGGSSPDLSGLATKQELQDAITQVETDLAPVDEVTLDNMQSVTSNAVAEEVSKCQTKYTGFVTGNGSYIDIEPKDDFENYIVNYGYRSTNYGNCGIICYMLQNGTAYVGYKDLVRNSSWVTAPTVSLVNGKIRYTHNFADGTSSIIVKV